MVRDEAGVMRRVHAGPVGAGLDPGCVTDDVLGSIGAVARLRARSERVIGVAMSLVWWSALFVAGAVLMGYAVLPMGGRVIGPLWLTGWVITSVIAYRYAIAKPVRWALGRAVWRAYADSAAGQGLCASCGSLVDGGACMRCGAVWRA